MINADGSFFENAGVSAVIPCFQCVNTIDRAIASIDQQTQQPNEVILVNDGSVDKTLNKLYDLKQKYSNLTIKIINLEENTGPGGARNVGWDNAKNPFIAFLDADDTWHPQKIEIQARWLSENPDFSLVAHPIKPISGIQLSNQNWYDDRKIKFDEISASRLLLSNQFSTPTVMLRRDIPYRFPSKKYYTEDYHLWCQICLDGFRCGKINIILAYSYKPHYGESGLSNHIWKMETGEIDTLKSLYLSGRINWFLLSSLSVWSFFKFFRRVLITLSYKTKKLCGRP